MRAAAVTLVLTMSIIAPGLAAAQAAGEEAVGAVAAVVLEYMDGVLSGDAERVAAVVHPELTKIGLMRLPKTGRVVLRHTGMTRLVEVVRARGELVPEPQREIEVEVFRVEDDIAEARVRSTRFYDLVHLVRINGQWKVLNALWIPFRPAPAPQGMALDAATAVTPSR
jgi:hypothetical protein